jgi:hypothetical protein
MAFTTIFAKILKRLKETSAFFIEQERENLNPGIRLA